MDKDFLLVKLIVHFYQSLGQLQVIIVNIQATDTSLPATLMTNIGAFSNAVELQNANTSNILNIDFSQVPVTAKVFYGR